MSQNINPNTEVQYLDALSRNFPNGYLFRFQIKADLLIPDTAGIYPQLQCAYLSSSWEQLSPLSRETAMNDFTSVFIEAHCEDTEELVRDFYYCLVNCSPFNVETRCTKSNGQKCWMQFSTNPRREGDMLICDGFGLNITERKQAEYELEIDRQRIQILDDTIPSGSFYRLEHNTVTGERRAMYLSANWERITGVSAAAAIADVNVHYSTIHPEDMVLVRDAEQKSIRTMSNFNCEVRLNTPPPFRWVQLVSHPVCNGDVVVWDGIMLDITDRKQMEQRLVEENASMESMSSNLPSCALYRMVFDEDLGFYRVTYLSSNWEQIVCVSAADSSADFRIIYSVIHPDDLPGFITIEHECFRQMRNLSCELRIAAGSGWRWVLVAAHPHTEEDGAKVWDGLVMDITDRKQTEQLLAAEKNKLESLVNNLPSGSLFRCEIGIDELEQITDPMKIFDVLRLTYVSGSWGIVSGTSKTDALRSLAMVMSRVHVDDQKILNPAIHNALVSRQPLDIEVRYHYSAAIMRWIRISIGTHIEGNTAIIGGVVLDVTDRKHAEQHLKQEHNRMESLSNNLYDGTLIRCEIKTADIENTDTPQHMLEHLHLTYVSASWERISNIPREAAMQNVMLPLMRVHPEDREKFFPAIIRAIVFRQGVNVEVRYQYTENETRWLRISVNARDEEDGIVCDGFVIDISKRKRNEIELCVYRDELELLVKNRTEELEATNEELNATNEELFLKNDQLNIEIAARNNALQKLADSEDKLRSLINQSFEGILMFDSEGRLVEWSRGMERTTGLSASEALGRFEWDVRWMFYPREERTPWSLEATHRRRIEFMQSDSPPIISELSIQALDGTPRHMSASTFQIQTQNGKFFGRIVRDNTRQRHAELELSRYRMNLEQMVAQKTRELKESNERLITLSNNLPGGIIYRIQDRGNLTEAQFTYISAQIRETFGINAQDLMNSAYLIFDYVHPEDLEEFRQHFTEAGKEGTINAECRIIQDSGMRWLQICAAYRSDSDGIRTWDGYMIDITERKNTEQKLEEVRNRQNLLISVLHILQTTDNLQQAIDKALGIIGNYAAVSRTYIFEKALDGKTVSNTYEWCSESITPFIDRLQKVPAEMVNGWFEAFRSGQPIIESDVSYMTHEEYKILTMQGIKSILVLPLHISGTVYGFIGFDECSHNREWLPEETELLRTLSHILSAAIRRFRAEQSVRMSQQTMLTVLNNVNTSIYVSDLNTNEILFANKTFKDENGHDIEERKCWKVIFGEEKSEMCTFCPEIHMSNEGQLKPGSKYCWEFQSWRTGRWYSSIDSIIEWVDNRIVHMQCAIDITERKTAINALQLSEERYRLLAEASPDAVVMCDTQGNVLVVSSKARELYRISDSMDTAGMNIAQFTHPDNTELAMHIFTSFVAGDRSWASLLQMHSMRFDGTDFYSEISSAVVNDSSENPTSVIMVIRDITDRLKSEAELLHAKNRAEESDRLKSAFLANFSHEIRTPLNGITGLLGALSSDPDMTVDSVRENIADINESSDHLTALIDDVLDIASIETGQIVLNITPVNIPDMMNELYRTCTQDLDTSGKSHIALFMDMNMNGTAPAHSEQQQTTIRTDSTRLRQVMGRLLGNAVKFTETGYISFGCRRENDETVEFFVKDTGIGIPQSKLDVVFKSFNQASAGNSRTYGGLGLGLSIAKGLVLLMGGDISAESAEGKGSNFVFTVRNMTS